MRIGDIMARFGFRVAFLLLIFEPTGTWFPSLFCPRIEHVSVTCWGYTNIPTISVVYALVCLANVSKWIRERESSFIPLFCSRSDFLADLARKLLPQAGYPCFKELIKNSRKYRMFFNLPSNHQNMSRNAIWLVNDTELIKSGWQDKTSLFLFKAIP